MLITAANVFRRLHAVRAVLLLPAFALLAAFATATAFIGWPVNAMEMDYLLFQSILERADDFEGTLYLSLAERVSRLSVIPGAAKYLADAGISSETIIQIFYVSEKAIGALGVLALGFALSQSCLLSVAALTAYILSGHSYFFMLKLITSTIGVALIMLVIAAGVAGRFALAGVAAGIALYIHPTYSLFSLGAILAMQTYHRRLLPWRASARQLGRSMAIFGIIAIPFIIICLVNFRYFDTNSVSSQDWFTYMQNRNDNMFPLRQGAFRFIGHLLYLLVTGWTLLTAARLTGKPQFGYVGATLLYFAAMYLGQMFFTEVIPWPTVTKLALNHRIAFLGPPLVVVPLILLSLERMRRGPYFLCWLLLFAFPFLEYKLLSPPIDVESWPRSIFPSLDSINMRNFFPSAKLTAFDHLAFALTTLCVVHAESARARTLHGVLWSLLRWALALVLVIGILIIAPKIEFFFLLAVLALLPAQALAPRIQALSGTTASKLLDYGRAAAVYACAGLVFYQYAATKDLRSVYDKWALFLEGNGAQTLNERGRKYRAYVEWLYATIKPYERMMIVPLRLSGEFTPVPHRSVYLDWYETNYILYLPDKLPMVVKKLNTYGIQPFEKFMGSKCDGFLGALRYRCQRNNIEAPAMHNIAQWRNQVGMILELDPKVRWVLTKKEYACLNEPIAASFEDMVLIDIHEAKREGCR